MAARRGKEAIDFILLGPHGWQRAELLSGAPSLACNPGLTFLGLQSYRVLQKE